TPADLPEILPHYLIEHYKLCTRYDALQWIHFPPTEEHAAMARHRLKWEELFLSQLTIARIRLQNQKQPGFLFDKVGDNFNIFYENHLPFSLTGAQKRVLKEIRRDTRTGNQMNRLLQGDVGSGKTMVALMTMLLAIDNGYQACLMAPTEILARQHYESISAYLQAMNVPVVLLIGSIKGKQRKEILKLLQAGLVLIAIGTHALIEDKVIFKNLGMAVIDEQHRFGVGQRAQLWKKNTLPPHILVMTATPIPRTLAMTLYGDLEVSELDELPPGRQPIQTLHRKEEARMAVMHFIRDEIDRGRQAYIVYPLIDESETLDYESLIAGYEQVKMWFNENKYRIAIVHGKQDPEEREINMKRFVSGHAHILVATTVIEVGVNVPNASVMFIESAERFGLSQLHQLRGRVGRGAEKSYCILMTGNKISDDSYKRVQIMVATNNGFEIAEKDMEMRGPGDMHGTRQSGALQFKLADIVEDKGILHETRLAAQHLLANDPSLEHPNHLSLKKLLAKKKDKNEWGKIS
ncbi:MAG: ATP-dependent DNA helicase RecG, partial [Chitinophagia bacterium]|nr:ATP-dependent DNA helicase RecG [Chitinophagia bacterium]